MYCTFLRATYLVPDCKQNESVKFMYLSDKINKGIKHSRETCKNLFIPCKIPQAAILTVLTLTELTSVTNYFFCSISSSIMKISFKKIFM